MQYYSDKGCLLLKGSTETIRFTEFWNNLFDNFNRNLPWQGLKLNDNAFQVRLFKKIKLCATFSFNQFK